MEVKERSQKDYMLKRDFAETEPGSNFTPASKPNQSAESVDKNTESEESKKLDESQINVSELKLMNSFDKANKRENVSEGPITRRQSLSLSHTSKKSKPLGNAIIDKELLEECIVKSAVCSSCRKSKLELCQDEKDGLAEHLCLICSHCNAKTVLETSKKITEHNFSDRKGGKNPYEINRRSVMASLSIGHAGLEKFCATMALSPPITKKPYNDHMKHIEKALIENAESLMRDAAVRLVNITEKDDPGNIEINEDGGKIAKVAVTVDGTWQRRGHSSKIGVVFVISVRTGEVLDYEVLSLVCCGYQSHQNDNPESAKYKTWKESHQNSCLINYEGSSGEMETSGACKIFLRSIEQRKLKYVLLVGDGDTGCFGGVSEACQKKFGDDYIVNKEECVGHVRKRLGTNLREHKRKGKGQKLSDGKGIGSAG